MTKLPLYSGFISQSLTRKMEILSDIYNRRSLMQENCNTGSEGTVSQIRDDE